MIKKFGKILYVIALLAVLALPLAACNTMEGLGRDTRAAGDALTGAASKNRNY